MRVALDGDAKVDHVIARFHENVPMARGDQYGEDLGVMHYDAGGTGTTIVDDPCQCRLNPPDHTQVLSVRNFFLSS